LTQNQPHQSRAPIHHNSEQQTSSPPLESEVREGEEADNEMVPSETEGEVAGRGGGQQARTTATGEELWAAAPKGFLSNLSAQEIQVSISHIKLLPNARGKKRQGSSDFRLLV